MCLNVLHISGPIPATCGSLQTPFEGFGILRDQFENRTTLYNPGPNTRSPSKSPTIPLIVPTVCISHRIREGPPRPLFDNLLPFLHTGFKRRSQAWRHGFGRG